MKVPFCQREKSAYAKMRRQGLSINQIANFFGRSTSVVHRTLKRLERFKIVRHFDMRKLPYVARMRGASFRGALMEKLRFAWELWVCGEEEKPP